MKDYNGKPKEKKALTEAQQAAFLEYVKHSDTYDYYYPMFQVMFSTALRCGELIGLTWKDIDFEKRTISINHQVNYLDYGDGYKHHCETTKTDAGFRVLPMSDNCYRALKMQREYQFTLGIDRDRETAGLKGFVFTSIRGHAQSPSNMNQLINRVRKSYNEHEAELSHKEKRTPDILPSMSCHTYRHTGCTRLAETHMDMKSLQEYMGHTDLRMTMNVYNHVTGDRMKKELEEAQSKCKVI
jgi:integrase